MAKVGIKDVKLYGYHGFFSEEQIIGGWFVYDVEITYYLDDSGLNDTLAKIIDYSTIYKTIISENESPKKLIETLTFNIKNKLLNLFPETRITVRVTKLNPPLGGNVGCTFFEC